jgi:muramoyltetrapeptide carboxypeptidase
VIGPGYECTANEAIIDAAEDEAMGGRRDDVARAGDIEGALADDHCAAIIVLRGGAWFVRTLPLIDFGVLDRRRSRVGVLGFSELTPLVNIVAANRNGLGVYGMGPVFLGYGLKRFAVQRAGQDGLYEGALPREWMHANLKRHFRDYLQQSISLIEGRQDPIRVQCTLGRGHLPDRFEASFVGGNLTVLSTMVGSRYESAIDPSKRWLVLEDYNDKPERFDRYLSHLTLAGFWDRCAGVLLGDFHWEQRDLTAAVLEMLHFHMPRSCLAPVLVTREVGHTWPMTPLPLYAPATAVRTLDSTWTLTWSPEVLRTIVAGGHTATLPRRCS